MKRAYAAWHAYTIVNALYVTARKRHEYTRVEWAMCLLVVRLEINEPPCYVRFGHM